MRKIVSQLILLASVLFGAAATFAFYRAGCAGDTKGGALGNPLYALELEGHGFALTIVATMLISTFAFRSLTGSTAKRMAVSCSAAVLAFMSLYAAGLQAEIAGVQVCFLQ